MVLVWRSYATDLGRAYPFYALSVQQINDVSSNIDPLTLLPPAILSQSIELKNSCTVGGLTPRKLLLWTIDGAQFELTYPQPFSENLADYLTNNLQIQAFEFVGERIKDGRLRRMLPNAQP